MPAEKKSFQAEVSRLLEIVAHSLYSDKDIFLRELISNASDACDRLRYAALTEPSLSADDPEFRVTIVPDKAKRTITIADNGIGMNRQELIDNLGTIARSGTAAFVKDLSGDAKKDMALIGQFGVGFYSAFMVADEVEVLSRKAGDEEAWRWVSDGKGEFTVEPATKGGRGTEITLHLLEAEAEFADAERLKRIITTYSDHIALPIVLEALGKKETVNHAAALWMRPRAEITAEQYREFYHHVGHSFDEPWLTLHNKAEGTYEYTTLLFVPATKPFDLFDPARKNRVKLYVRRVFITDDCPELLPPYLRFLKGVVDSEDLPLNVSREMLQKNPMLTRMRGQITRRVLQELGRKAKDAPEEYAKFWDDFGAVLKEGLYEDAEQREALLGLVRFRSTAADGLVSLDEYVARMKPGQKAIYTITGDNPDLVAKSPQLEGFRARGVEVLLMTDPVDEFWMPALAQYKDHPFTSVTRGQADLDALGGPGDEGRGRCAGGRRGREPHRALQAVARRCGEGRACLEPAHRQRGLPRRRRGRSRHASGAALEAASPACRRGQAHPRDQSPPSAHRPPQRTRGRGRAPPTRLANSPGCCSIRRASSKARPCPIPRLSRAGCPCCWQRVWAKRLKLTTTLEPGRGQDGADAGGLDQDDDAAVARRGNLGRRHHELERPARPRANAAIGPHRIVVGEGLPLVFAAHDRRVVHRVIADEPDVGGRVRRRGAGADFDEQSAVLAPAQRQRRVGLVWRGHGGADQPFDRAALRADALRRPVHHHLRREDEALVEALLVGALARRGPGPRKRVGPADVVPIVDVEGEGQKPRPLAELAQIGIGRRTGIAALGREELDHDGRPLFRPGRRRDNRKHGKEKAQSQRHTAHPASSARVRQVKHHHSGVKPSA